MKYQADLGFTLPMSSGYHEIAREITGSVDCIMMTRPGFVLVTNEVKTTIDAETFIFDSVSLCRSSNVRILTIHVSVASPYYALQKAQFFVKVF